MAEHYVYKGKASLLLPNRFKKMLLIPAISVTVQSMPCMCTKCSIFNPLLEEQKIL